MALMKSFGTERSSGAATVSSDFRGARQSIGPLALPLGAGPEAAERSASRLAAEADDSRMARAEPHPARTAHEVPRARRRIVRADHEHGLVGERACDPAPCGGGGHGIAVG